MSSENAAITSIVFESDSVTDLIAVEDYNKLKYELMQFLTDTELPLQRIIRVAIPLLVLEKFPLKLA